MKLTALLAPLLCTCLVGCTTLNPRSLTQPVATPQAAFEYSLGANVVDAEGNQTVAKGDVITVDQTALKDNWSINLHRSYYDTTLMPREGMANFAKVLEAHAVSGNAPTAEQLLLYAGSIETLANYDIPLVLSEERADVQRANDPEAFAAARVAQFQSASELARFQTDRALDSVDLLTPYGAASGAFGALLGAIGNGQPEPQTQFPTGS